MALDAGLRDAHEGLTVEPWQDGRSLRDEVLFPKSLEAEPSRRCRDGQARGVQNGKRATGTDRPHLRRKDQGNRMQLAFGR